MTFITAKKSQSSLSKQKSHPNWDLDNLKCPFDITAGMESTFVKLDSVASEMLGILKEK